MRRSLGPAISLSLLALLLVSCAPRAATQVPAPTSASQQATGQLVSADDLAKSLGQKDLLLLNVHVP